MRFIQQLRAAVLLLTFAATALLSGCSGSSDLLADGGIIGTGSIIGTVPGTIIEAYGEQGEYLLTYSDDNNTGDHPFRLDGLPAGVGFYLVMITNEDTANEIIMPIAFEAGDGTLLARIVVDDGQEIDLGHIPLYLNCSEVPAALDADRDCVLEKPFILDETMGSRNPLKQMDADHDTVKDYFDDDHGYGPGSDGMYNDPQDHNGDRIPNYYDPDFTPGSNDHDGDGIDDTHDRAMSMPVFPPRHG